MKVNEFVNQSTIPFETLRVSAKELINDLIEKNTQLQEEKKSLKDQVTDLTSQILQLQEKNKELEGKLAKNSQNSSKSPNSDGLKKQKTRSQREVSGKKPGGQPGRQGKTLSQVDTPEHIITHTPDACTNCAFNLSQTEGSCVEKRQIFDLPNPKIEVTEHRVEAKACPCCGKISKGIFPENVIAPVQYGERVQVLTAYFRNQHLIPVERVCEIFEDVFDVSLSAGTCSKIDKNLFAKLESFEASLKAYLIASKILHFDETGMRCEKKLHWVHVASSEFATFYGIHAKRGQEAINEFNILPQFRGTICHDHWLPYFAYTQVQHALCNAHHLRELTYMHEQEKEDWAKEMRDLLLYAKKEVKTHLDFGSLPEDIKLKIEQAYAAIIKSGIEYHENLTPLLKSKRGKQKQRVGKNLIDRLNEKKDCVLRFIYDFSVPFTNNLGEQDIRMMKVKQKISGCFRTHKGGQIFCRIRSYISTARKQGFRIWDALVNAIKGSPLLLPLRPA